MDNYEKEVNKNVIWIIMKKKLIKMLKEIKNFF